MLRLIRVRGLATVQDLGRDGFRAMGVPAGGAMDREALQVSNAMVGNPDGAAALELALGDVELEVTPTATAIAVAGSDGPVTLDGVPVDPHAPVMMAPGQRLVIGHPERGRFRYLAVAGGVDVPRTLGSRSTYLPTGWGGFRGRRLEAGDDIPTGLPPRAAGRPFGARAAAIGGPVRVTAGPQSHLFPPAAFERFAEADYEVLPASDRMGTRLLGPALPVRREASLPSEGTCVGAVQVPDDGQPIVLLRDGPTVGGYPKIGVVISADLDRFCQIPPGMTVGFRWVSVAEAGRLAQAAALAVAATLRSIRAAEPAR